MEEEEGSVEVEGASSIDKAIALLRSSSSSCGESPTAKTTVKQDMGSTSERGGEERRRGEEGMMGGVELTFVDRGVEANILSCRKRTDGGKSGVVGSCRD